MTARRGKATRKARRKPARPKKSPQRLATEIDSLGRLIAREHNPVVALEHLLTATRRLTGAEAGTVYLRRGEMLEFAVVQNDVLELLVGAGEVQRRVAARPLSLRENSIAAYVVATRSTVNLRDAYAIPRDRPYALFSEVDTKTAYTTRSVLATPLRSAQGRVFGVLQLINALDRRKAVRPFSKDHQALVLSLAALAAHLPAAVATG